MDKLCTASYTLHIMGWSEFSLLDTFNGLWYLFPSGPTSVFPGGSAVKNLPAIQEQKKTWVQSLSQEDLLEIFPMDCMATHSNIFAWEISWKKEPGRLLSIGLQSWTQLKMAHLPSSPPALEISVAFDINIKWSVRKIQMAVEINF